MRGRPATAPGIVSTGRLRDSVCSSGHSGTRATADRQDVRCGGDIRRGSACEGGRAARAARLVSGAAAAALPPESHVDRVLPRAARPQRLLQHAGDAADTIDARGKLVVPGLLDIHTHTARSAEGPGLVLQDGVTGWIDAGTQGADHIADTIAVARSAPQQGRVLINIGRAGLLPEGDTMDLKRADVGAARDAIAKNRDFIVGVKARLSRDVAGANDYEVLRRAQEVATPFGSRR